VKGNERRRKKNNKKIKILLANKTIAWEISRLP
jgi:hypothetical protein